MSDPCVVFISGLVCVPAEVLGISIVLVLLLLLVMCCCLIYCFLDQIVSCLFPLRMWRVEGTPALSREPDVVSEGSFEGVPLDCMVSGGVDDDRLANKLGIAEADESKLVEGLMNPLPPSTLSGPHLTSKARYLAMDGLDLAELFKKPGGTFV